MRRRKTSEEYLISRLQRRKGWKLRKSKFHYDIIIKDYCYCYPKPGKEIIIIIS